MLTPPLPVPSPYVKGENGCPGAGMKDYLVSISLYPTLRRINRTPSSLKSGSGVGADPAHSVDRGDVKPFASLWRRPIP